ncbi:hypothetical protein ABI59_23930 [Acidobacteria bacterium Mor1]|nr:hypothetical protein ABI59_23930 [Acidobacteria bacterium Mor1]
MRRFKALPALASAALLLILGGFPAHAVNDAVEALEADVTIERTLLELDTERYRDLASRRGRALTRLTELYRSLDGAVSGGEVASFRLIEERMQQIRVAESERVGLLSSEHILVDRIQTRLQRILLLEQEIARVGDRVEEDLGELGGDWDVSMMPLNQNGVFSLSQQGTLLSGTYELDGGWTGSLQGTLVNRKVYLVRIDSRLGRSMEFEGYLSGDAKTIRGTWLNYELAGQDGSTGQWTATRTPRP